MILKSRINRFLPKELLIDLDNISRDNTIRSNNRKVDLIVELLNQYSYEYDKIAPGTNRYSIIIDNYVFKIALDSRGKVDNWAEFYLSRELQPYVTKTYECNGLIAVAEYVSPIPKDEFISIKDKIRRILDQLSKDYLFGDMGTITKNFMNWGMRADGQIVCLDYAYTYRIIGNEMICGHKKKNGEICQGFLEYDEDFNKLKCPHCGKEYDFIDIKNRMRRGYEDEVRENAKKLSVHFPHGVDELEVDDDDINSIIIKEDINMKYNEDNTIKYTEEEVEAMLYAEIDKCYAPIKTHDEIEDDDKEEKIHIDMNAANASLHDLMEVEYESEEAPPSKESIARKKYDKIVDNIMIDKEFYHEYNPDDDEYDDDSEWFEDQDITQYFDEDEPVEEVTDYPNLDDIIEETYESIEVEEDDVIEPTISRIEVLEDTTETVDDKSNEEVVKEILDDANEIVSNYKEDKIVEEETETVTITVDNTVDNVETSTIEIVTEDNATTVNTNKTKEEKPVQSFIKVLDEDDNELDRMRESLLDDEYDDQYDEMYDQAMRESKIRNNRMS